MLNESALVTELLKTKHVLVVQNEVQNSLVSQVKEKYFKDEYGSKSTSIKTWKLKGLSNQSLSISGTVSKANDLGMSKPIRPA